MAKMTLPTMIETGGFGGMGAGLGGVIGRLVLGSIWDGCSQNFITQTYNYLKTLPDYKNAKDS